MSARQAAERALLARSFAWGRYLEARSGCDMDCTRRMHAEYVRAHEAAMRSVRDYRDASGVVEVAA